MKTPTTYKGYLIGYNMIHHIYFIRKGGCHIGSATTLQDAKDQIDLIAS